MRQELLVAVLTGLGGMFGWGLADFFAKKTIDQVGDVVSLAWGHIFGTLILVLVAVYRFSRAEQVVAIPHDWQTWLVLFIFGAVQATVYLLVYKGFSKGQVGVLSPIFASFSGLTALLSIVILGEMVRGYVPWGLFIIFIGILLINVDMPALRSRRLSFSHIPGFTEVGLATLLAALWTLGWDRFIGDQDWLSYAVIMYACMTVVILGVAQVQRIQLLVVNQHVWIFLALIGVCETVAYLAISIGYSTTSLTSVIALLSGAFSLPTIILARVFLKERITPMQTAGSLIIIGGIMLLSVV